MARKEDRKKQKKRLKEQKKASAQAKYAAEKAKAERYPEITYETSEGNGYFVAEVRAVAETLDFDSPEMGPDWMRQFYREYRKEGLHSAVKLVHVLRNEAIDKVRRTGVPPRSLEEMPDPGYLQFHLGECIFAKIPVAVRQRFLPMNDFATLFKGSRIILRFTSLLEEPSKWGTVYYSRLLPKVEVDGRRVTVASSDHAITQMCRRRVPRYLTFAGNGDAHAYLAKCVYHEVITLRDGSQVIRLWDLCDAPGFRVYEDYVEGVFGESNRKANSGRCHYILGYCPFVVENGFAKAKSFLYPGFRGTPERALLDGEDEQRVRYVAWLEEAEDKNADPFYETPRAIEVTKWFHDNGMPQVIQMTRTVIQSNA